MAQSSTIEWTDATWNPVTGCSKVSPGCAHCYAETLTARFAGRPGYIEEHRPWTPENAEHNVRLHPERLEQPPRWKKPRMVFVNSMSDLFHELVPFSFILRVFLVMQKSERHTFQVLTKRPERMAQFMALHEPIYGVAPNIWLGVSIENARHTWRADVLREIPAVVRFISAEPLLGSLFEGASEEPIVTVHNDAEARVMQHLMETPATRAIIDRALQVRKPLDLTGIDWLIVGGESGGRDARPMRIEWVRELRDASFPRCCGNWVSECCGSYLPTGECCGEAVPGCCEDPDQGPAFFFKQWGSWTPVIGHLPHQDHNLYALTERGPEPFIGFRDGFTTSWDEPAVTGRGEPIVRYVGVSPKSGGRELDGRTWDEMPS